ncbi:MAG TPA: TolC family protein [Phycisphaerae bacterium]|nr:TolC family protein [Phycisphaerae bacterium]HNU45728.1 TolC family protein [Phycisphaerae bacterium]
MNQRAYPGVGVVAIAVGLAILFGPRGFAQSPDDSGAPAQPFAGDSGEPTPAPEQVAQDEPPPAEARPQADLVQALITGDAADPARLLPYFPDPEAARTESLRVASEASAAARRDDTFLHQRFVSWVETIRRPERQVHLTLEDALRRTLANNYGLKAQGYNPAIENTRVVEAQAAFDAVLFAGTSKEKTDQPTATAFNANLTDTFAAQVGVRKLLPLGTQVSARHEISRRFTNLSSQFQYLNPSWTSDAVFELRQPLLRNFGVDVNRAQIVVSQNNRQVSDLAFQREVRDLVRNVEEQYWRLVQARRDVVISAQVLADFELIYQQLEARKDFDVTQVQLAATKARLERSKAAFVQVAANVRNAQDRLLTLLNDPELDLADELELIPDDFPLPQPLTVDRLAEVQTALDCRPEIREQELRVASAKLLAGQAKNAQLPQLDLAFRFTSNGLAPNADRAFDQMTTNNYLDYYVGVEFEWPIGNRGPRAAYRRALLQHAQAAAALKQQIESIILDVNLSLRQLLTAYEQIGPNFESVLAGEEEVRSIVARAERKDINTLNTELSARESLAQSRRNVIDSMIGANVALIDLERAKGTLLRYNNIVVAPQGE